MIANLVSMEMDLDVDFSGDSPPLPTPLNTTQALWDLAMLATSTTQWPLLLDTGSGYGAPSAAENFSELAATETPYVPYGRRPETYIVPILFALIFVVGVLGNGTLIVVFLSVRQMRNVPNTYILSLALADLLVIVTTVPLASTVYTVEYWPYGSFLCSLSEFMKDVSIGVSVFTLTALSGDRYFAIVDPLRKFHAHGGGRRATRMTLATAVSIWLLAILCGLPALLGSNLKHLGINEKSIVICYPYPEEWGINYAKSMVLLHFLVYYALPLVIIAVFYVLIALHLMYSASVPGEIQGAVRQVRARRKVAVTVLAFVVIFGICFLPYHVFFLWFYFWPTAQEDYNAFWHVLRIVAYCMSFANSCANPVALYFVSGAFRKHFNRYLFCRGASGRRKKRGQHDTFCMHRDTSLTSTASKRFQSRHSCYQSTIRSCRLQETTITTLPNGGNQNGAPISAVDLALPVGQAPGHNEAPPGYGFLPLNELGQQKRSHPPKFQESLLN
ncbi:neuropeptide CCHamide-1 receptor [Drosophila biarmipes]|uniref:neuropeptide CCHamide-1 receptor n=1 Tax=Drosophila biarmipes TaxID=125945 RepID=UPI0007E7371A|nr:neuropeptide CCHamide-1 receptor [Drosophila biarmipes]